MKTVMKKMFSLLLVAVMLVGVMPFAAFADDGAEPLPASTTTSVYVKVIKEAGGTPFATFSIDVDAAGDWQAVIRNHAEITYTDYNFQAISDSFGSTIYVRMHPKCSGQVGCPAYDGEHASTCLSQCLNSTSCTNGAHVDTCTSGCNGTATCPGTNKHLDTCIKYNICDYCKEAGHLENSCPNLCEYCTTPTVKSSSHVHCTECQALNGHLDDCDLNPNKEKTCTKCGATYTDAVGHVCCDRCKELHATADCPYCTVCWPEDKVITHKASDHCEVCESLDHDTADHCTECGKTDGTHKMTCSEYESSGNALVRVHVRLHNGTTLVDTVELLTYRDDKGTQIGDSVSAHKSLIVAELAEEYPEYSWSGNLYDDPGDSQDYNELIGTGTTVYINAYAGQDMVLVYVHNSRSHSSLRIIQLEGKRRGDTVTKKEVTSAVSKYYNVSSLSMYSEDAWEDYVDGENVESVSSLKIPEDDSYYVIDVKISGTAKSGSSSGYTADSSNPKTGDTIFAPVAVMGLSVSALAVLLYLNKKRAF